MIDLLVGSYGMLALYCAAFSLLLIFGLPFVHGLGVIGKRTQHIGLAASAVLLLPILFWMAVFYGAILVHGDFGNEPWWHGRALVAGFALLSCWLVTTPIMAIRRQMRAAEHSDD